jgi:hypothetical protein
LFFRLYVQNRWNREFILVEVDTEEFFREGFEPFQLSFGSDNFDDHLYEGQRALAKARNVNIVHPAV